MPTDPARVQAVFLSAADLSDPVARSAYLEGACAGDTLLRARVEALLCAHDQPDSLLDIPAVGTPDLRDGPTRAYRTSGAEPGDGATHTQGAEAAETSDTVDALAHLAPAQRPDSLGRIGHYEVLEVLGRGGFGVVFRAFDDVLQRVVAVKALAPSMAVTSPARKRFLREARSSAQVRHDNVVQIHAVEDLPLPHLVMEFVPGETLQARLDRTGPLEMREVVRVARQVAEGLAAAHEKGLIHRDIKPANILIESGPHERVKITDFGLARAADDASLTRSGVVAGTPMYMAPEQARGESLDPRADLFSLGSVMYAMLTGRPPFRAENTPAVLKRVADDTPRPIPEVIPEVPEWLCRIVEKLHAKKPEERFQTAREVADLLADCEKQLQAHGALTDYSRIPGGNPHPRRSGRRWKRAVAALVLLLAVAGVAYAGPFALRYANDEGKVTLVEPGAEEKVLVRRNGEVVATLDAANDVIHLSSGEYELETVCKEGYEPDGAYAGTRRLFERMPGRGTDGPVLKLTVRRGDAILVAVGVRERTVPPSRPADGFVSLFNGKDLTGWRSDSDRADAWVVEGRELVGRATTNDYLISERGDYRDYHLRLELRINDTGRGGHAARCASAPNPQRILECYAIMFGTGETGTINDHARITKPTEPPVPPDTWFTHETIIQGNRITVLINGQRVLEHEDNKRLLLRGHVGLGLWGNRGEAIVHIRKIEIKELPPHPTGAPLAVAPFDAKKAAEHQKAWADHLGVPVEYENGIGMKLRLIPPGDFQMGYTKEQADKVLAESEEEWEKQIVRQAAAKPVRIAEPFYLGTCEVTVGQFRRFVEAKGYKTTTERNGKGGEVFDHEQKKYVNKPEYIWSCPFAGKTEDTPVHFVTVEDAEAFCAWLSEIDGRRYVLPRPEQWEYACRAGTTTLWWTGDSKEVLLRAELLETGNPRPVGSMKSNPFGLYDMHGNICEWVRAGAQTSRRGSASGNPAKWAHSARHQVTPPAHAHNGTGFRVAIIGDLKGIGREKPDAERLLGPWVLTVREIDGKPLPLDKADKFEIHFRGNGELEFVVPGASPIRITGKYEIDPVKKQIRIIPRDAKGGFATWDFSFERGRLVIDTKELPPTAVSGTKFRLQFERPAKDGKPE